MGCGRPRHRVFVSARGASGTLEDCSWRRWPGAFGGRRSGCGASGGGARGKPACIYAPVPELQLMADPAGIETPGPDFQLLTERGCERRLFARWEARGVQFGPQRRIRDLAGGQRRLASTTVDGVSRAHLWKSAVVARWKMDRVRFAARRTLGCLRDPDRRRQP